MERWRAVLDEVAATQTMLALWGKHVKKNPYAFGIELARCCVSVCPHRQWHYSA